jgi:pimeloyl-ACP methyl ester carboxylesterase
MLPRVVSRTADTDRLRMHYLEADSQDGIPVVLLHRNLSTGRFFEQVMSGAPDRFRDWVDDTHALVRRLGIERPLHLAGWSTGGAAVAAYAIDRAPVASLTLIDPISPYGYGGVKADGTPCFPDYAGSGGGTANPEFGRRLAAGDRSSNSPASPRNVMNMAYWSPNHREPAEREELLLDEILKPRVGDDGYPGDSTHSPNWPGFAPGSRGILKALSGRCCDWSSIVGLEPKPPILWTQGSADIIVAAGARWEMGTLGKMGAVPGWPGEQVFPPQPMVTQIRAVLERYRQAGGDVRIDLFEGSGHFPPIDTAQRWNALFFEFIESAA